MDGPKPRHLKRINSAMARKKFVVKDPAKGLIDPRRNKFVPYWDVVMMLALAFTAIVTPVEVALIDDGSCITPLWMINRLIDLLFIVDIRGYRRVLQHRQDDN